MKNTLRSGNRAFKVVAYTLCIILTILSLMPFVIMVINSTRSTYEIQQHAVSLIPGTHLFKNFSVYDGKTFNAWCGFLNSIIISTSSTALVVYFSALTAYALVAYEWKLRGAFFTMILLVMMIPSQVTSIGFYQFMYKIGWTNSFLPRTPSNECSTGCTACPRRVLPMPTSPRRLVRWRMIWNLRFLPFCCYIPIRR